MTAVNDHAAPGNTSHSAAWAELMESLAEGVLILDHNGRVTEGNSTAASILGAPLQTLRGRGVADSDWRFVREDGTPFSYADNPVVAALRTGQGQSKTIVGADVEGLARRWVLVSTAPMTHDNGEAGLLVIFDDITSRIHSEEHLRLLLSVSRLLTAVDNEEEFFKSLCHTLVHVGGYAIARVDEALKDSHRSVTTLYMDGDHAIPADTRITWDDAEPIGRGPIGSALRTGQIQVANDLERDPRFAPWRHLVENLGIRSLVAIPFELGERRVALAVYGRYVGCFDPATVQGLEEIAKEARFGSEFVHSMKSLEDALDGSISALSLMTETRDPYTAGHQNKVGNLAEQIALRLGIDGYTASLIRQSGALHDVGKIAIPAEILTRPGRLSPLEFEMVKRHTVVGGEILRQARLPWPIAEVALHHHERLDGSGYPDRLRGEEISIAARVVMVADVVEAMTQHRPYRPALGLERALHEVNDGAGVRFDADVVAACTQLFAEGYQLTVDVDLAQFL